MGLVVTAGVAAFDSLAVGFGPDLARLVVLIPLGGLVFAGMAFAFRLEGREELLQLVRQRLLGKASETTTK